MYGITNADKNYYDLMIEKQKNYLTDNKYSTMSANIVPDKFIAELNNRIDSIVEIAKEDKCVPIFLTITAPSMYHPSSQNYNNVEPHETALYLSKIWGKFLRSNVFKRIKKDGFKYHYIKVFEPMKSSVPHIHGLFFVPRKYLTDLKKSYFWQLDNENIRKQRSFIFQFKKVGYHNNFDGARAYMTKYLTKTFRDSKTGKMSDVVYWYMKHRIRRFSMSKTNAPLNITRKINYIDDFRDVKVVTDHVKSGRLHWSGKKEALIYHYFDKDELEYKEKDLWFKPFNLDKYQKFIKHIPIKFNPNLKDKYILKKVPVYLNDDYIGYSVKGRFFSKDTPKLSYDDYSDLELYHYLKILDKTDINNLNLVRYGVFKEEAIRRGIIDSSSSSIDDYNEDFDI